jgi:Tetratricopeptide repeat
MACLPATDVGVGDVGRTAGRATGELRRRGAHSSHGGARTREVRLKRPTRVVNLSQLAQVYTAQGRYVETEPVLVQVLKIYQTVHGDFPASVVSTLNNLGILHCVYRQHAQAEHLLTMALAIKEELLARSCDMALSFVNLPQLPMAMAAEKVEPLCPRTLAIREWAPGPFHPEVEGTPEALANALREQGRADEAVSLELRTKNFRAKRS